MLNIKKIGIRHEGKYIHERRVAIIPEHLKQLLAKNENIQFLVQKSPKRIYSDTEYLDAQAFLKEDISDADVIIGVKEVPLNEIYFGKTYIFFSHVIKGQAYNMPMLQKLMDCKCNLIDYEKITDSQNRRLIFFGRYAGNAGCIDTLWALGQRFRLKNINSPLQNLKQTCNYDSLEEARSAIISISDEIKTNGLYAGLNKPFVIGITGYGNVAKGVFEILHCLDIIEITPERLLEGELEANKLYFVVFKEQHISKNKHNKDSFELSHYYNNPQDYENNFEQYFDKLSLLFNCMYWDNKYPRLISKENLIDIYSRENPNLLAIGDISCDINGPIASTVKASTIDNPVYIYNPLTGNVMDGFEGEGLLTMAVDILPTELPKDSSISFSNALKGFIPEIVNADFSLNFENLNLSDPIKKALILHNGNLTPDFEYIKKIGFSH